MAVKWTDDQQKVIDARGSNLLVSAAAGSGKTAVLVERIIRRILDDEHPVDIDRLLVVTFTRAAAAEMRERVTAAIEKRCIEEPENERLQRQQALVHNAQITTIDSFCAFIVRNHFGDIGIEPNFRVADQSELDLLRQDVIREVFEACYKEAAAEQEGEEPSEEGLAQEDEQPSGDEMPDAQADAQLSGTNPLLAQESGIAAEPQFNPGDFLRLVDAYSGSRNDTAVKDMVLEICRMSESSPWPREWVSKIARCYQAESPEAFERTDFMQEILMFARLQLTEAAEALTTLLTRARKVEGLENYAKTLEHDVELMVGVCEAATAFGGNLDAADKPTDEAGEICREDFLSYERLYKSLRGLDMGNMAKVMKFKGDASVKKYILDERGRIKKEIEALRDSYFTVPLDELYAQTQRIRPMAEQLAALSLRFLDAFADTKRQKRMVSFADMEHFALNILVDEKTKELRPAAVEFQDRFEEIMIDEYQDSNQVQEEILTAVSRESQGQHSDRESKGTTNTVSCESRGQHNRFMVGDIKQSIYRFRLARPEIFMEKYRTFDTEEQAVNRKITLARNFRSRPQVLDFVNDVFVKIMQPDLGSVAYDADAMLYLGADYPQSEGMEAEVLLYDSEIDRQAQQAEVLGAAQGHREESLRKSLISEEESPVRMEIHMIAQRIRQLHGQLLVKASDGQLRPLRYGDIAILMRGVKSSESDLLEILSDAGIPVQLESSTGYFSSQEVRVMLAFLQILDNPLQDIPLAAVLHSPIAGISDEQLAQIRIAADAAIASVTEETSAAGTAKAGETLAAEAAEQMETSAIGATSLDEASSMEGIPDEEMSRAQETRDLVAAETMNREASLTTKEKAVSCKKPHAVSFSEAAWDYLEHAPAGSACARFYELYNRMRSLAQDTPIHELIGRILQETGYRDYVCMLPAGHKRAANLDMLVEKAADYEQTSYKGLFHFVRYIEKLRQYDVDFGEAQGGNVQEDAVSVMTIHQSKGLEFPVVFVAGIGKKFNQQDSRKKMLLHADLGIGLNEIRLSPKRKIESLIRRGIADRITRENLGEELRIFYVAMTRAKEKLILTGTIKDYDAAVEKCTANAKPGRPLGFAERFHAGSYLDWILPALQSYLGKYEIQVYSGRELQEEEKRLARRDAKEQSEEQKGQKDDAAAAVSGEVRSQSILEQIENADDTEIEKIRRELSYVYPYAHEAGRKSKYSVSELKHDSMLANYDREQNEAEIPDFLKEETEAYVPLFIRRRDANIAAQDSSRKAESTGSSKSDSICKSESMDSTEPDSLRTVESGKQELFAMEKHRGVSQGALRGTAVHRVMECLDFRKLLESAHVSKNDANHLAHEELSRMRKSGLLSPEYASLVPLSMLSAFLQDPIALRMAYADARGELFREKPFVMEKDGVLIQGIIDVFWKEDNRIVLLDYKTDAVQTADELAARYQTQLELYAEVLMRLFGEKGPSSGSGCDIDIAHSKDSRHCSEDDSLSDSGIECMMYSFRLRQTVPVTMKTHKSKPSVAG